MLITSKSSNEISIGMTKIWEPIRVSFTYDQTFEKMNYVYIFEPECDCFIKITNLIKVVDV